jgi:hypothetical protein
MSPFDHRPVGLSRYEQPVDRSQAHSGCTIRYYRSAFYRQIGDPSAVKYVPAYWQFPVTVWKAWLAGALCERTENF